MGKGVGGQKGGEEERKSTSRRKGLLSREPVTLPSMDKGQVHFNFSFLGDKLYKNIFICKNTTRY